ncbi:MAG: LptF/LptG family permease [Bacteroidota bacterium]
MKILDRYIFKKFLLTFVFILGLCIVVVTLIDFTEKNGHYIKYNVSYKAILEYYAAHIPFMVNLLTPITVFITTVFVTSRLAQRTEIVAILSSGISFLRFLRPYLMAGMCIVVFSFLLTGWGLAKANLKRIAFETEYNLSGGWRSQSKYLHIRIAPEQYLYVERYRPYNNTGTNVMIETIRDHRLVEKLSAYKMVWLGNSQQWRLEGWLQRKIDGLEEIITHGKELDMLLNIHPSDFSINPRLHEVLTLPELNTHIQSLKEKGADSVHIFLVEKYVRYMSPFAALILIFMGVVIAARKTRGGMGLQIGVGFVLAFVYIAFFLFARGIAEAKGTALLLTVWTPNIVFSMLSVVLYRLLPK